MLFARSSRNRREEGGRLEMTPALHGARCAVVLSTRRLQFEAPMPTSSHLGPSWCPKQLLPPHEECPATERRATAPGAARNARTPPSRTYPASARRATCNRRGWELTTAWSRRKRPVGREVQRALAAVGHSRRASGEAALERRHDAQRPVSAAAMRRAKGMGVAWRRRCGRRLAVGERRLLPSRSARILSPVWKRVGGRCSRPLRDDRGGGASVTPYPIPQGPHTRLARPSALGATRVRLMMTSAEIIFVVDIFPTFSRSGVWGLGYGV
jgi:hypothetical protein